MSIPTPRRTVGGPSHVGRPSLAPVPLDRRPTSGTSAVVVTLEVPGGADVTRLLDLAGTLHELALDLVPDAQARTEIRLDRGQDPSAVQR